MSEVLTSRGMVMMVMLHDAAADDDKENKTTMHSSDILVDKLLVMKTHNVIMVYWPNGQYRCTVFTRIKSSYSIQSW